MLLPLVLVLASCSSSGTSSDASSDSAIRPEAQSEVSAVVDGADTAPQATPTDAVEALLEAERQGDHATSFALVLHGPEQPYPSIAQWTRRRRELPAITAFSVEANGDSGAIATVEHVPMLDPFLGLQPARERQTWSAERSGAGWLLQPEPETVPMLPPDSDALGSARAWAQAVQECDQDAAVQLQAVAMLFGSVTQGALCGAQGDIELGEVGALVAGPASADVVAQYSADALEWARTVPVVAPVRLVVVLAPLGDAWKVIGVSDAV